MKLTPLADQIVARLLTEPEHAGHIEVVRLQAPASTRAEVVAVGPDVREVRVGQRVLVSRLQGIEVNLAEPLVLLPEGAVLAFLEAGE